MHRTTDSPLSKLFRPPRALPYQPPPNEGTPSPPKAKANPTRSTSEASLNRTRTKTQHPRCVASQRPSTEYGSPCTPQDP